MRNSLRLPPRYFDSRVVEIGGFSNLKCFSVASSPSTSAVAYWVPGCLKRERNGIMDKQIDSQFVAVIFQRDLQ